MKSELLLIIQKIRIAYFIYTDNEIQTLYQNLDIFRSFSFRTIIYIVLLNYVHWTFTQLISYNLEHDTAAAPKTNLMSCFMNKFFSYITSITMDAEAVENGKLVSLSISFTQTRKHQSTMNNEWIFQEMKAF